MRDGIGLALYTLLTLIGLHAMFAVGFTWHWHGQPLLSYRQPAAGFALFLIGLALRWLISPAYRRRARAYAHADAVRVRDYAGGGRAIPWRAAFWWVFVPALAIYLSNGRTVGSGDTAPMLETAVSLIDGDGLALDRFIDPERAPYYACRVGDHFYSRFSLGPAVLAVPVVQTARWLGAGLDDALMRQRLEKVIASLIAAATAALIFLVMLRVSGRGSPPEIGTAPDPLQSTRLAPAYWLTAFFVVGSQNWSIASQALWQHGPVALCVAAVLFLELHAAGRLTPPASIAQGLLIGLAVACRPTAAIFGMVMLGLAVIRAWRRAPWLLAGAVVAYAPFLAIHVHTYHAWLGPYAHAGVADQWGADLRVSLPGNLVSPARGLFVYQPLLLLAVGAILPRLRRQLGPGMAASLLAWLAAHWIVVSCYRHWWGGHAWGPRFFTESMPALVVLAAPAVAWLWRWRAARPLIVLAITWSVTLQAIGAYSPASQRWMKLPVDIDRAPSRLWDWHDPPFLRFLR